MTEGAKSIDSLEVRRFLAESFLTEGEKRRWPPRIYRMARALIQTLDDLEEMRLQFASFISESSRA